VWMFNLPTNLQRHAQPRRAVVQPKIYLVLSFTARYYQQHQYLLCTSNSHCVDKRRERYALSLQQNHTRGTPHQMCPMHSTHSKVLAGMPLSPQCPLLCSPTACLIHQAPPSLNIGGRASLSWTFQWSPIHIFVSASSTHMMCDSKSCNSSMHVRFSAHTPTLCTHMPGGW